MSERLQGIVLLEQAYYLLLQISPTDPLRFNNQRVYCGLRDEIAELSGLDPETVQRESESHVYEKCSWAHKTVYMDIDKGIVDVTFATRNPAPHAAVPTVPSPTKTFSIGADAAVPDVSKHD